MQARIHHPRNEDEDQPRFLHISWPYAQDYCEYHLYLEQVKSITVDATPDMVTGSHGHQRLEDDFLAKAELEFTFEEAVERSKLDMAGLRELLYTLAKLMRDYNAIKKGKVGQCVGRRATGKVTGKAMRKLFK